MNHYTLIRHSAFEAARNPQFERAVEIAIIHDKRQLRTVKAAGGLVFDSYSVAADAEYAINYPPAVKGIIPEVLGKFHPKRKLHSSAIYVPTEEETEKWGGGL